MILTRKFSASSQDYLETILELSEGQEHVHSIDVAAHLGVSRASVNRALKLLKDHGYIEQERYSSITLTAEGRRVGQEVLKRHEALKRFLVDVLGVSEQSAEDDACLMEHSLSAESLKKLQDYLARI